MPLDLYVGAAIGRWALQEVGPNHPRIRTVVSYEEDIRELAEAAGYQTAKEIPAPSNIDGGTAFSVHFPKIFKADVIDVYEHMYNLHPGLLPWGRGYYPVFWALWENTPAGGTLHEIVEGVDKGAVVDQAEVTPTPASTGGSLHAEVIAAEKVLFQRHWQNVAEGNYPASHAVEGKGSYHSLADFLALRDNPPLDELSARDLIRLIRALTYEGRPGPMLDAGEGAMFSATFVPLSSTDTKS